MKQKSMIKWLAKPKDDDYVAAQTYLSLVLDASLASKCAKKLSKEAAVSFKAKDIFRASELPYMDPSSVASSPFIWLSRYDCSRISGL